MKASFSQSEKVFSRSHITKLLVIAYLLSDNVLSLFYLPVLYFDVASGCLIDAYPGTGGVFDPAVCKKLHLHAQYFYDGSGKKCYVFDAMYC